MDPKDRQRAGNSYAGLTACSTYAILKLWLRDRERNEMGLPRRTIQTGDSRGMEVLDWGRAADADALGGAARHCERSTERGRWRQSGPDRQNRQRRALPRRG
jgi:hypothetical protein